MWYDCVRLANGGLLRWVLVLAGLWCLPGQLGWSADGGSDEQAQAAKPVADRPVASTAKPPSSGVAFQLGQALRLALEHHPGLQASKANVQASGARVRQSIASFLPRLDGTAQYQRATKNFVLAPSFVGGPFGNLIQGQPAQPGQPATKLENKLDSVDYTQFSLAARLPLIDFGRTFGSLIQAQSGEKQAEARQLLQTQDVLQQAVQAFHQAWLAQQVRLVSEQSFVSEQKHLAEVQEFVTSGIRPIIDVSAAQVNLENNHLQLVINRNKEVLAMVELKRALGGQLPEAIELIAPVIAAQEIEQQEIAVLLPEAIKLRPDLSDLRHQRDLADTASKVALGAFAPSLSGLASFNGAKVANFDVGWNGFLGVGLEWNIFAGGQNVALWQEAEAGKQAALALIRQLEQGIEAEIKSAQAKVQEATERLMVAGRAEAFANEQFRLAEDRYQAGLYTLLERDDSQLRHTSAQITKLQAQSDVNVSRVNLLRTVGKLTSLADFTDL